MIKRIWCSLLSNDKPQDKNVIWIDTANPESYTIKLFRNGDWKPIQTVGTTRDMIERELTGNITSHYHSYDNIANKPTTLEGYGITNCFNKVEIERLLNSKQDTLIAGDNITIEGNIISSTGGSIDLSAYAKKEDVNTALGRKQDTIADLDTIRQGAQKGSTALQSESDPVYLADKPKIALKVEIPDVSGKVDKVTGKGLSSNDYTDADKLKLTGLENYDDTQVRALIAGKQDTIADLDAIREGAALGKTALQEHQDISGLATKEEVATKQDKISDLDTIREGATKGATALQSYTEIDPIYTADKPSLALKTEIPDISGKADKSELSSVATSGSYDDLINKPTIPSKTSELTNDSGYLNSIPSEYVTETELNSKGYLTEHQDISGKADKATTLAGYGIGDAYTKNEVDAAISSAITTTLNTEV